MDIDSPPEGSQDPFSHPHQHLELPLFSASFPLPFRVLFLIGLAIFLWATNLHILHSLGLDTSWILDFRDEGGVSASDDIPLSPTDLDDDLIDPSGRSSSGRVKNSRPESGKLYGPVYKLFILYSLWVGTGWLLFRLFTSGETESMESWRGWIGLVALGVILGIFIPWRGIGERERHAFKRSMRRICLPKLDGPVFFSDVILADILTSFAKVLGDLWVSGMQIWNGGITQGRVAQEGWANWVTLFMVCLPYLLRFRQCLLEYYHSSYTNTRSLANALKYFSAFPVILLSAAQKAVISDLATQSGLTIQEFSDKHGQWLGENTVFRLWLLAVVINSMYSFWWDIEMDWGLSLCELETWFGPSSTVVGRGRSSGNIIGIFTRVKRLFSRGGGSGSSPHGGGGHSRTIGTGGGNISHHQRSPAPTPSNQITDHPPPINLNLSSTLSMNRHWTTFGLRQILLLPDPIVYHLFTIIDLILRFTWSLKLSSHLHTISEIESGVFMMEALELLRRWMWVFVRVEWEAVKKSELQMQRLGRGRGDVVWQQQGEDGEEEDLGEKILGVGDGNGNGNGFGHH